MAAANPHPREIVGVFRTPEVADEAASDIARATALGRGRIRRGDLATEAFSLRAEMREETDHTMVGPGPIGPWTKETLRALLKTGPLWALAGAVVLLPFGLIPFGGWSLGARLGLLAIVGAFAGATAALSVAGLAARHARDPLAAERGFTVAVATEDPGEARVVADVMARHDPIRVDLGIAGMPMELTSREPEDDGSRGGRLSG